MESDGVTFTVLSEKQLFSIKKLKKIILQSKTLVVNQLARIMH